MRADLVICLCLALAALLWFQPWESSKSLTERATQAKPAAEAFSGRTYTPPASSSDRSSHFQAKAPFPRLVIPRLQVDAHIQPITTDEFGALKAPDNYNDAGWWIEGPFPGRTGAAIIAGHVDSQDELGVFWHLRSAKKGDKIIFEDGEGHEFVFKVTKIGQYSKDNFPSTEVYPHTNEHLLHLITCGGSFSDSHYEDNLVVFSKLVKAPALSIQTFPPPGL